MTRTIFLVACVKKKQNVASLAKDLYISDWFRKAAAYAERNADAWYILSAKYGLIEPNQVIEPYDVTLNRMPAAARRAWAQRVMGDLHGHLNAGDKVIFLAGIRYRQNLIEPISALGCQIEIPMQGLRIGKQLRWLKEHSGGKMNPDRLADVKRFYEILDSLEEKVGGKRTLADCNGYMNWPKRGVYFFFEPGEYRTTSGSGLRVVRVGTHGLKRNSKSTLWKRLSQHRGTLKTGGGNHRGSVFRLHVGLALIQRDSWTGAGAQTWGKGSSAKSNIHEQEGSLERAVSQHIRSMPFLWIAINDEPGPESLRGYVELNSIALLSNYNSINSPIDMPGQNCLGSWSASEQIRRSGLWNVNHIGELYNVNFLSVLENMIK